MFHQVPTRIECILRSILYKNNPSELRSDFFKDTEVGGEQILVSTLLISGCGGEVCIST